MAVWGGWGVRSGVVAARVPCCAGEGGAVGASYPVQSGSADRSVQAVRPALDSPGMRDDGLESRTDTGGRSCGECRACCMVFDVPEFGKPRNEMCVHADTGVAGAGCGIYARRPERCRAFSCAWKQGLAGEADRPDVLGVMMYLIPLTDGDAGLGVVELEAGAIDRPRVRALLGVYEDRKPGRVLARRAADDAFAPISVLIEGKPMWAGVSPLGG